MQNLCIYCHSTQHFMSRRQQSRHLYAGAEIVTTPAFSCNILKSNVSVIVHALLCFRTRSNVTSPKLVKAHEYAPLHEQVVFISVK